MATRKSGTSSKSKGRSSHEDEHEAQVTTDHDQIRKWVEERGGKPSCVRGTGGSDDVGLLRIDFPGYSGEKSLQEISWDEFFEKFDEQSLALLYQEETKSGEKSNFNKLVSRETANRSHGKKAK
jgi:hypothetical protein